MLRDGLYRRRSVLVRLEIVRAFNRPNGMPLLGSLGKRKQRLRQIEATYRKTTKPDSRNRGLLAGDEGLRSSLLDVARAPMAILAAPEIPSACSCPDRVIVARDERCCALLRWDDVLAMWCCNVRLWGIA
jgi:hypothetical protein